MLFSSIFFLFTFLPILLIVYFAVPFKYKNYVLLAASLFFYAWGEPIYVFLMIFSIAFNWAMALDIEKERKFGKKTTLIFTVVINLLILSFFKYYGFALDSVNALFGTNISYTALPLPIGISFYTFQAMSYIIDVYRGDTDAQRSPLKFGLYLSLFPQLIAGPIVKYKDIAAELDEREISPELIGKGSARFIIGLAKKVIIANNMGALHTEILSQNSNSSVLASWLGVAAYTLQIYFDFSGYSDMAIGLGKVFGFNFMENFNYPYISKSVTEFWRRWHISLSTWFRDYLYFPLGGNRVAPRRHIINLLIVWMLTGLWHGASWNFVVWGLYYGIFLILEKYFFAERIEKLPSILQHLITIFIVSIAWVFFFSSNLTEAIHYLGDMFMLSKLPFVNMHFLYLLKSNLVLMIIAIVLSHPKPYKMYTLLSKSSTAFSIASLLIIFIISVSYLVFSTYNPFLYFRF